MKTIAKYIAAVLILIAGMADASAAGLLNVSYDVARALYEELNPVFAAEWKAKTGEALTIDQSHAGSSKQARAVIDGLPADVVTMNSPLDIDVIAKAGLLPTDWAAKFPNAASPSWSAIVFVVRRGNPKTIKDWPDLIKPGIAVVLPNPKTSGNGRYSYLAAWQFARTQNSADAGAQRDLAAFEFEKKLLANVPVLDVGGRDASVTFAQRSIGDVLLTFESEARALRTTFANGGFEIIYPSLTVRADNPVAVVARNADKKGTSKLTEAYLQFHYAKPAQEIFAKNGLRVVDADVTKAHADFPALKTFTVEEAFGGWAKAQPEHFAAGGTFDKAISEAKK